MNITKRLFVCVLVAVVLFSFSVPVTAAEHKGYIVVTDSVKADSGNDVSAEIQKLIDNNPNRTIYFPDGEYLLGKPIYTPADPTKSVSLKLSDFAVLKAAKNWKAGEAIVQLGGIHPANDTATNGSNYSLEGGIIDGSSVANGVSINSGRETAVRNVSIKNTVVGLHSMNGANGGSSDADIFGVNIIGTGKTDSVGILIEGHDNTITNVRIGYVFTGVHLKAAANMLRNVHPLYYSDYTDYQNSCGFLDEAGNNWYDYCYSDQFAIAFRTTDWGENVYNNCYCYWYSPQGEKHTAFRADKQFNATITNFKAGFGADCENVVLSAGENGGNGTIENLEFQADTKDNTYKTYLENVEIQADTKVNTNEKHLENGVPLNIVLTLFGILLAVIAVITIVIFIYIKKKLKKWQ